MSHVHNANKLDHINEKLSKYISMFNTLLYDTTEMMYNMYKSDFKVKIYSSIVKSTIKNKPVHPISEFTKHMYDPKNDKIREKIYEGNEDFFMNDNNFDKNDDIMKLFQFRNYWKDFDDNMKSYMKNVIITMCEISKEYLITVDNGNKIKKNL